MGQIVIPLAFKCSINVRYHIHTQRVVAPQHPTVYVERRCRNKEKVVKYLHRTILILLIFYHIHYTCTHIIKTLLILPQGHKKWQNCYYNSYTREHNFFQKQHELLYHTLGQRKNSFPKFEFAKYFGNSTITNILKSCFRNYPKMFQK